MSEICHCRPNHYGNFRVPQIWGRTGTGTRIEDLTEQYYERVLDLFRQYYIPADFMCQATGLNNDDISQKFFLENILFHLKNISSIIAIDESLSKEMRGRELMNTEVEVNDIAGVLAMRVIKLIDYGRVTSRVKLTEGEALKKCVHLRSCLHKKVDLYAKFKCNSVLRYYYLCISPKYRSRGLGFEMMKCGLHLAHSKGIPLVMGIFFNWSLQNWASKIGMKVVNEMDYNEWKNDDGSVIFNNVALPTKVCALMAKQLLPPVPFVKTEKPKEEIKQDDKSKKGK